MPRRKHPIKELEAVLQDAESKDWDVAAGRKYFKMKCPCPDEHLKIVHISPSGGYYLNHLLQKLRRDTCWEGGEGK